MTGSSRRWSRRLAGLGLLLLVLTPGPASAAARSEASTRTASVTAVHAVDLATVPAPPRAHAGHELTRGIGATPPAIAAAALALLVALGCALVVRTRLRRAATVVARTRRTRAPPTQH